jgi:spermidine synthase
MSRAVEVRRAGGTVRLYVGGVLASQWHPRRTLAGGYWDALATAPLLLARPCRSALVLGLGGGAVVSVLRRVSAPPRVVGVEADRTVLRRAAAAFPLRGPDLEVVVDDARSYLERGDERFDLVVDDVYEMAARGASRPARDDLGWFPALVRRASVDGAVAVNFIDEDALRGARPALSRALESHRTVVRFDFDRWQNVVVAAAREGDGLERYEAAFAGAVPGREARARGFCLTAFRP